MKGASTHFADFLRLIRFEHTLFALPWALTAMLFAAGGWPRAAVFLWILVAMVAARTAAMTFNRLVDRRFDADNERTRRRPSVTGQVSPAYMTVATVLAAAVFVSAAYQLNPLAGHLAVPTLVVLLSYSLTKRFFTYTHFVLGFALSLSPLGAWVAVRGEFGCEILPMAALSAAVLFWTAGFDMLYACQDRDFDVRRGLFSVPARFGIHKTLLMARCVHMLVPCALFLTGYFLDLSYWWWGALTLVTGLLIYEHSLVRPTDLSRVDRAFFQVNVVIAFLVLLATTLEVFLTGFPR